jgi:hypothetical protein
MPIHLSFIISFTIFTSSNVDGYIIPFLLYHEGTLFSMVYMMFLDV